MEFKFYEETIVNTKDLYAGSPLRICMQAHLKSM